jgi:hypothetical protein
MGSLLGKPKNESKHVNKKAIINDKDKTVLDLKNARDRLKKYRRQLDKDSLKLQEQAKTLLKSNQRDRALLVLGLKKYKQKEATKVDTQLMNVFDMIDRVEWGAMNVEVMKALEVGTKALNKLNEEMPIDRVQGIMDEAEDSRNVENEISQLISGNLDLEDEEELEREFQELGVESPIVEIKVKEEKKIVLPDVPTSMLLPQVPTTEINPIKEKEVEKQLFPS